MRLEAIYRRRGWLLYAPITLAALLALWWTGMQFAANTPRDVILLIHPDQSPHLIYAARYQDALAERGIRLSIERTAAPLRALQDALPRAGQHYAALSVPALGPPSSTPSLPPLQALAAVAREPIWIFANSRQASRLQELAGQRVGLLANDANARIVADALTQASKVATDQVKWKVASQADLVRGLLDESLDAALLGAHPDSDVIRTLARVPHLQLLSIDQLGPLTQGLPQLRPAVLPKGAIELRGDIPSRDITLLTARLHLLVQADMPPALQRELLDAARRVHERPSFMHRNAEFPNTVDMDVSASPIARAFTHGARPWLERVLPYGLAQLVQWLMVAALPLLILAVVLLRWIPRWFDWRVNASLQTFYGELKFLETEFDAVASERPIELKRLIERIDGMERQVVELNLPQAYAERWYTLRQDLHRARERLLSLRAR